MSVDAGHERLKTCCNTAELRAALVETYSSIGEVLSLTTICAPQAGGTLCVVDFVPGVVDIVTAAAAIGGRVFGLNSVIVPLSLSDGFTCPKRAQGLTDACACAPR